MKENNLPLEFQALAGKVSYISKVSHDEYSSSCPQCGGAPHRDGSFPDRFRMFLNAKGKNRVMGWCRNCSYVWFPNTDKPISREEMEKWRLEQIKREEERRKDAEQAIMNLRGQRIWEEYHRSLNEWSYTVLHDWGITDEYINYWKLGLIPDFTVWSKDESYHSPGISIPIWQFNWEIKNVKVRVLNPRNANDRYRKVYKIGQDFPFVCFPAMKFDTCLLVEGEKKAMVSAEHSYQDMQVVGLPTKTPNEDAVKTLEGFGKIYVCLDPDASIADKSGVSAVNRLCNMLGKERVGIVELPGKIDDLIVKNGLRKDGIRNALKCARKMEAK